MFYYTLNFALFILVKAIRISGISANNPPITAEMYSPDNNPVKNIIITLNKYTNRMMLTLIFKRLIYPKFRVLVNL